MRRTTDGKRRARRQRGFTLVEIMVSMVIFSLLMLAVMGIFVMMLQMCASVTGASSSSIDASNAIQRITLDVREAENFELMEGTGQYSGTSYGTTYVSSNNSVTGIYMTFPADYQSVQVQKGTGSTTATLSTANSNPLYNTGSLGTTLQFYRADYHQVGLVDGTPDPNNGNAIYMSGTENRATLSSPMPIVTSIAPGPDSVQFIQPYSNPDGTGQVLTNEIKVKLTCAYFDPIHGETSSETSSGTVTSLTGECVYLRDHNPNGASSTQGAIGRKQLP